MKDRNPYENFQNYVLRQPLLPFSFYKDLTLNGEVSDDVYKKHCQKKIIREAIFNASPLLLKRVDKWINDDIHDKKKIDKLKQSIFKYLTRISTRATPFGMFAGCSVGKITENTKITLAENSIDKYTRLDMGYLMKIATKILENQEIRKQIKFYPNNSLYKVGYRYRYIEFVYVKGVRQYRIAEIAYSDYIKKIINIAEKGVLINDITIYLESLDISISEANSFIDELILNQILVPEIEPSITGDIFFNQLKLFLEKNKGTEDIQNLFNQLSSELQLLNSKNVSDVNEYLDIEKIINKSGNQYNSSYLFQTDLMIRYKKNTLNKKIVEKVKKSITILNIFSDPYKNKRLESFQQSFYQRYGTREVSLLHALDVELGIIYGNNKTFQSVDPLLDGLALQKKNSTSEKRVKWSEAQSILLKAIINSIGNNEYILKLRLENFNHLKVNWDDVTDTLSCMVELIEINNDTKVKIKSAEGVNSSRLLGRFGYYNDELHNHIQEMMKVEKEINNDKIIAEVVHMPGDRIGNVLMRPDYYNYEIPILTKSNKPIENQISLNDLLISTGPDKGITLRSKKNNKVIIPRITNAHNFHNNVLPVYQFLGDMQTQSKRGSLTLNLGNIISNMPFIPRIEYEDVILQNATWNLKMTDINGMTAASDKLDNNEILREASKFRKKYKIPQYIIHPEGDNELVINLNNITSIKTFIDIVKKKEYFSISECLYDQSSPVKKDEKFYVNEIILGFYNKHRLKRSKT